MVARVADMRPPGHRSHAPMDLDGVRAAQVSLIEALFRRYRRSLLWYLSGLVRSPAEAEDVAQEAFLRLLGAAQLEADPHRARNYLFATATNVVRDNYRRKTARAEGAHVAVDDLQIEGDDPQPERIVDGERGKSIVDSALRDLQPRPREAFLLYVQEEMTYERIALKLGVSKKTIERDIALTLALCRERLMRWHEA
jgi:RNA polymerase sigma factor (sigma-70 family)